MGAKAIQLEPPPEGRVEVLFIAGEHSGDQHAALIAREMRESHPDWRMSACGGPALAAEGVQILHDLTKDSVVGLVEVLRHYGDFKRLFNGLLDWVEAYRPKAVVMVDYPGFNLRFAEALSRRGLSRKSGGPVVAYQYVSPQIWAWKAQRRFKMAKVLDELGVIFPFELNCYKDTDLPVHFVGHPFAREDYMNPVRYDPEGPVLFLPGSRRQAVSRIFPVMMQTLQRYRENGGRRSFVCLYPEEGILSVLEEEMETGGFDPSLIELRPVSEGASASAVLTSSGTMSLNCALAGIPGAIVYRAHPLTVWIGQRLIKVDWLGIANLVLGHELYPEYLQKEADPSVLANRLEACIREPKMRETHAAGAMDLLDRLQGQSSGTVAQRVDHLTAL
ncbi:MAG: lipid-A-disaccharide synthase [Opitutales bacterium]|jgi:lipid-A-disaccharide synthase